MNDKFKLIRVENYKPYIGNEAVERILKKNEKLADLHIAHIDSTYYGRGIAELLSSLTLSMSLLFR
ncbi:hypothetical protein DRQ33_01495 [bacterium]|nr:MAG: hypothetical protein DRQ33_01495 [bacterium]